MTGPSIPTPARDVPSPAGAGEWRAHWPIVLAGVGGLILASLHVYSLGAFMPAIEAELGWTRSQISFGLTISSLTCAALVPFMGMAIDRFGPRRIALPGAVLFLSAFALLSTAGAAVWTWWALWFLLALTALAIMPAVWTAAVASVFVRHRGLALAIALSGTGLSSTFIPLVSTLLIAELGWRLAYVVLAALLALLLIPVFFIAFRNWRYGRSPVPSPSRPVAGDPGAWRAVFSLRFQLLGMAGASFTVAILALVVNLLPFLASTGIARTEAAAIAGLVGVTSIGGRLFTGYLLDRVDAHLVGAISLLLPIASCLLFASSPGSVPVAIVATLIAGAALGAELDVVAYLTAQHFGMERFGTLFGTITGLLVFATAIGPVWGNYIYDVTGAYTLILWATIPLYLLASLCLVGLGILARKGVAQPGAPEA